MKRPTVTECLNEIRRLKAENERLTRLATSQRPELTALRSVATTLKNLAFNLPMQMEELHAAAQSLLGTNDDLPSLMELRGCLSNGRDRVEHALGVDGGRVESPEPVQPGKPAITNNDNTSAVGSLPPQDGETR